MPISESLHLDFEADLPAHLVEEHLNTRKRSLDAAHAFMDEFSTDNTAPSVFMDASNPLLS